MEIISPEPVEQKRRVITEDLGKIFEMAICLLYEIEYDGPYKYSMEEATQIKEKLQNLRTVFPKNLKHSAKNGSKYDFTDSTEEGVFLSAKTTKKDGKVSPQVIGQPSKKKFCQFFGLEPTCTNDQLKDHIVANIHQMLAIYMENTFDCPVVYYNKNKNTLLFIKLKDHIDWSVHTITFTHISNKKVWNESSSLVVNGVSIGEFQVHNHRDCIKFRWAFEKLLDQFKDNFEITNLL